MASPARPLAQSTQAGTGGKQGGDQGAGQGKGFFSELWDIINPLQHLPVIGMAYRAITGQQTDDFARVAGDALYGGLWGAVGAVADVAFEAITGKTAEDTVLSWLDLDSGSGSGSGGGTGSPTVVAANIQAPRLDPAALQTEPLSVPLISVSSAPVSVASARAPVPGTPVVGPAGLMALSNALAEKGITGAAARTALYAYRQSVALTGMDQPPAPFAVN